MRSILVQIRRWSGTVTALALVWIGIATYDLERSISRREVQHSKVSRSIALYQKIAFSKTWQELANLAFKINHEYGSNMDQVMLVKSHVKSDLPRARRLIHDFLQHLKLIDSCRHSGLCDEQSVGMLFGTPVLEIFLSLRSFIYCDQYIWDRFGEKSPESDRAYIDLAEDLVMDFLQQDQETFGYDATLFRKPADIGDIPPDKPYIVIAMHREGERCKDFSLPSSEISP